MITQKMDISSPAQSDPMASKITRSGEEPPPPEKKKSARPFWAFVSHDSSDEDS